MRALGSSPHTRGLPGIGINISKLNRIIPAHAGFTSRASQHPQWRQDHPRTRGVYASARRDASRARGSSPHTRGLPGHFGARFHGKGIIPAHAGFTVAVAHLGPALEDHPRTRGVYVSPASHQTRSPGSSPHTRGLPSRGGPELMATRIIPAHAGFTAARDERQGRRRDHPRTRGVYVTA
mgnify:CR=1 FL=1